MKHKLGFAIKKNYTLIAVIGLTLGCDPVTSCAGLLTPNGQKDVVAKIHVANMKKQVERTLSKKYNVDFKVTDVFFEFGLNLYIFTAHPKTNKKILFEGQFDERKKELKDKITSDGFVNQKFSFEAGEYFSSLFPNKNIPMFTASSVYSLYEHGFGTEVPSLDEYLANRPEKSTIRMNCYFFDIPSHPSHQLIISIQSVLKSLHKKYQNNFSLFVGFWPSGFLEGKKLENLTFGFEATKMEDADNLLEVMQYLSKVLFVKIVKSSIDELDNEKIFKLIKDDNKKGMNEMVEF